MLSKYINMNPLPWLTDGINPAVTFLAKKELLKEKDHEMIYTELLRSKLTDYFRLNFKNGVLGDSRHPDLYYRGTVWFFLLAAESGYSYTTDFISSTADYLCKKTQQTEGGFTFSYKSSDAVGCRTGNMIYSLLKCGISGSGTERGINWIIHNQRADGGWLHCPFVGRCAVMKLVFLNRPGNGLKYENNNNIASCPVASYACMKALSEYNNPDVNSALAKGVLFLQKNSFFIETEKKLFCGNRVNFGKIGYPLMSQYDFLSGLVLYSKIQKFDTSVPGALFNSIIKKQNQDGSWNCENALQGMIKEKNLKCRWTTLNALRLINSVAEKEDQLEKA